MRLAKDAASKACRMLGGGSLVRSAAIRTLPGRKQRKVVQQERGIMFGEPNDWRRVATRFDRCLNVFVSVIARTPSEASQLSPNCFEPFPDCWTGNGAELDVPWCKFLISYCYHVNSATNGRSTRFM